MKRFTVLTAALVFALCFVGATWAHVPEGVQYYVFQWPDEHIPTVDGDISEWDIVPDVYMITHENFSEDVKGLGTAYDASDWDIRYFTLQDTEYSGSDTAYVSQTFTDLPDDEIFLFFQGGLEVWGDIAQAEIDWDVSDMTITGHGDTPLDRSTWARIKNSLVLP